MNQAPLPPAEVLEQAVSQALDLARRAGASQAEAAASVSRALTASVRLGEVESVELQRDRDLHVEVLFGQRSGSASTNDLSSEAIARTVEAACAIARSTEADPYSGLAEAHLMATAEQCRRDLQLYHPLELSVEAHIERARACEAMALQRVQNSEGASFDSREGISAYGNSHGFLACERGTSYSLSCSVVAEREGDLQTAYDYDGRRCLHDLRDGEAIGAEAARQALAKLGARRVVTQQAPVLFDADTAKSLYKSLLSAIRGAALHRRSSFLLDQIGQPVLSPFLSLHSQPFLAKASNSGHFDGEGMAAEARCLVQNGVLQQYLLGSYAARKMGLPPNSSQSYNVQVHSEQSHSFQDLLRQMGRGLLVTDLMGQGVNLITGDYSRGASGFWVEGGEIAYPVQEITIAGNLKQLLQQIVATGTDVDDRGNIHAGSVWVESLQIAGE